MLIYLGHLPFELLQRDGPGLVGIQQTIPLLRELPECRFEGSQIVVVLGDSPLGFLGQFLELGGDEIGLPQRLHNGLPDVRFKLRTRYSSNVAFTWPGKCPVPVAAAVVGHVVVRETLEGSATGGAHDQAAEEVLELRCPRIDLTIERKQPLGFGKGFRADEPQGLR